MLPAKGAPTPEYYYAPEWVAVAGFAVASVLFITLGYFAAGPVIDRVVIDPPTATLTVLETTTLMGNEDTDAYAVATEPDGRKVLLAGAWVEGQTVTAYPHQREGSTQPVYSVTSPEDLHEWILRGAGMALGWLVLLPLLYVMIVSVVMWRRGRRDRSDALIDAVLQ